MKHLGTKTIRTERLVLRRFTIDDAAAMYENWASDPAVTKYLMWPCHDSVEVSKAVLADWVAQYERADYYQWAIVMDGVPIGNIAVVQKDDAAEMAHIGYCIGQRWWKQGITSEALGGVMGFLFNEVGVNRIEARHDPRNPNSGKVMLRCGMQFEGLLREADWNNQGRCDSAMYAILAKDYFAGR